MYATLSDILEKEYQIEVNQDKIKVDIQTIYKALNSCEFFN